MAEGPKVRLVRCPKCENVLPELPDYTVYKCGSCGAVLRAKKKAPGSDGVLEQSDDKWGRRGSEKLDSLSEKAGGSLGCASETERETDGIEVNGRKERIFREEAVNSIVNSVSEAENEEDLSYNCIKLREEVKGLRLEESGIEKEIRFQGRYMGLYECPDDYRVQGDDCDMNLSKSNNASLSTGENLAWPRTAANMIGRGMERDGFREFYRNSRAVADQRGYQTFAHPDEGPSSYKPESFYDHVEQMTDDDDLDARRKVEQLEQDRAELLRKLDELKDQLSRSCAIESKPRTPIGRTRLDPNSDQNVYNVSMQPFAMDKHVPRPPYLDHTYGNNPFTNHHNMGMQNFYPPSRHVTDEFPLYEEPYQPRMRRRPFNQPPSQYPQQAPNEYFRGQYMESNPFASYQPENFYHQPACSCLRCLNHNWHVLPRVPPISFTNKRIQKDLIDSKFYHCDNPGPHGYNPQAPSPPQLTSQDRQRHTRWTSDFDLDIDDTSHICPRRVVAAYENRQHCYPVGDGAPFITCYICFEILKLPRRLEMTENKRQKLQCGGCSTVILFEIVNKKLMISFLQETKRTSFKGEDGSKELLNESHSNSRGCLDAGIINSCSDDFDNSGHGLDLTDNRRYLQSEGQRLNLSESENITTSSISSSEEIPDTVTIQGDASLSSAQTLRDDLSPKLSSSLLRDYSYCPSNQAVGKYGQGNNSKRVDQDMMVLGMITSRQNSAEDTSLATELEVSFSDYLHTSLSQDSVEVSKEKGLPKIKKGTESFFVGLMKKSFREFSRSTQNLENERPNVSVNGQPLPDRLVKNAEKLAGRIQPGDYWYDFQAGFWGVIGHPCFGIIPPFIEEFNYAMPTNCAGGNTGVHVNGRELNKKDLDLLASRGLPTTGDRFYSVDIYGKVVDEETGEELDGLGKLAPTVLKAKRGFGMKVPKSIA